jgi:hypothetical protein
MALLTTRKLKLAIGTIMSAFAVCSTVLFGAKSPLSQINRNSVIEITGTVEAKLLLSSSNDGNIRGGNGGEPGAPMRRNEGMIWRKKKKSERIEKKKIFF